MRVRGAQSTLAVTEIGYVGADAVQRRRSGRPITDTAMAVG
jgi:hypothetical protein